MRRSGTNIARAGSIGVAVLLAGALMAWVMSLSVERGRLAMYPRVDDVIYMARGAELWRAGHDGWERGGVGGMVRGLAKDWRREPPHSPWASVCAAMGFGVFGVKEWAAYVFTGVPVLAFVLACGRIGRRGWRRVVLMGFAASAPFLAASVQNLKPDYCCGIASAIGMMLLLRGPLMWGSLRRLAWAGVMFGLALLAKPAMMVPTGLLCVGTVGICVLRDLAVGGRGVVRWASVGRCARAMGLVCGAAIVVALPHYIFALGHAWAYTTRVLDGESYALPGTRWDRAMYYVTGQGGRLMLDGVRTLAAIAGVMAGYGIVCMWGGLGAWRGRRAVYFAAIAAAVVMAWAGPTMATAKIQQFAAAFDALVWMAGVYAVAGLMRAGRGKARWVWRAAAWAAMVWVVGTWRPTFTMLPADRTDARWKEAEGRNALVRGVYAGTLAAARDLGGDRKVLSVVAAGSPSELGVPLLEFWSVRDGVQLRVREVRRIPTGNGAETPDGIGRRILGENDLALVGEVGTAMTRPKLVTAGADAFFLEIARTQSELELAARVTDPATGRVREVYRRK